MWPKGTEKSKKHAKEMSAWDDVTCRVAVQSFGGERLSARVCSSTTETTNLFEAWWRGGPHINSVFWQFGATTDLISNFLKQQSTEQGGAT